MPQAEQCPHFVSDILQCIYMTKKYALFAKMAV